MRLLEARSRARTFWFNPEEVATIDAHIHHHSACVTDPTSPYLCTSLTQVSRRHGPTSGVPNIWFECDEAPELLVARIEEATR